MKISNKLGSIKTIFLTFIIFLFEFILMNFININKGYSMQNKMLLEKYLNRYLFNELFFNQDIHNLDMAKLANKKDRNIFEEIVLQRCINSSEKIILAGAFESSKSNIIIPLLQEYLFDSRRISDSKTLLRRLADIQLFNGFEDTYPTTPRKFNLAYKMNNVFNSSRRLLFSILIKELVPLYYANPSYEENNIRLFVDNDMHYNIDYLPKKAGVQFGLIFNIKTNNDVKQQFYIKAYTGYHTNAHKGSIANMATQSSILGISSDCKSKTHGLLSSVLNLKEPFIYKVLEELDFGPKTHFIINPYINSGFYIATESLDTNKQKFIEIGSLATKANKLTSNTGLENRDLKFVEILENYMKSDLLKQSNDRDSIFKEITKIDMIARIFRLEDFNTGNFGCVVDRPLLQDNKVFSEEAVNKCEFKVIDFVVKTRATDIVDNDIGQNFLSGNTTIKYNKNSIMSKVLKNRGKEEKYYFGKQALLQFEDRLIAYGKRYNLFKDENLTSLKEDVEELLTEKQATDTIHISLLQHLFKTQINSITSLMKRERGNTEEEKMLRHPIDKKPGEERYRNRINAELIGFKIDENIPDDDEDNLQYLTNAINDLKDYPKYIIQNYNTFKEFVENGY